MQLQIFTGCWLMIVSLMPVRRIKRTTIRNINDAVLCMPERILSLIWLI